MNISNSIALGLLAVGIIFGLSSISLTKAQNDRAIDYEKFSDCVSDAEFSGIITENQVSDCFENSPEVQISGDINSVPAESPPLEDDDS